MGPRVRGDDERLDAPSPTRWERARKSFRRLRLGERADQTGRLLDVAVERLDRLVTRQAGRERGRLEIGRHQREDVVVLRAGRGAGPEIVQQLYQAGAADIFVAR